MFILTGGLGGAPAGLLVGGLMYAPTIATTFEDDLVAYLSATVGVQVYPGHIPQLATKPAVSYFLGFADREKRMNGFNGIVNATYTIVVASTDYTEVNALSQQIRQGLSNHIQRYMGGTLVFSALLDDESMDYSPPVSKSDRGVYQKSCDYSISYRESIPTN